MRKQYIYLDDLRTPIDADWVVVRSYDEFVQTVSKIGLKNILMISLDHDLGDSAMKEWHSNTTINYSINYDNITEKTGMDCAKWLVEQWLNGNPVCEVRVHSANAVGSANMMGYINNYRHVHRLPQSCIRWVVPHTIETIIE